MAQRKARPAQKPNEIVAHRLATRLHCIESMIRHTKQNWAIGNVVKVGFLKLRVVGVEAVKDGLPDIYELVSLATDANGEYKRYQFIPHNGLTRIAD